MNHVFTRMALLVVTFSAAASIRADEPLLPADRGIGDVVDHYLDAKLKKEKVDPAPAADELTVARRLYLDLAGRIPTAAEAKQYAASTDPKKRLQLIDDLIASVGFPHHNANEFDRVLVNENTNSPNMRSYLFAAFTEKRPWDRMFRDILGLNTDQAEPNPTKPQEFVRSRLGDQDLLTRDVSSIFFGLNISCAQCHKHPEISALTQDYFFGMKAFFARTQDFQGFLIERHAALPVSFTAKNGKTLPVVPMFLSGEKVELPIIPEDQAKKAVAEESKLLGELNKEFAKTKKLPPPAELNLRQQLADLALSDANRDRFAKAIVNRLFHRFYGRGLVMRLDAMHAENPASHPELLAWLSRDFIAHKYDLVRLIRGLVSSQAYARSSRWEGKTAPAPELFAVAAIRPLSRQQWFVSHQMVNDPARISGKERPEVRQQLETFVMGPKKSPIEEPRDDLQIGIGESLTLSNSPGLVKATGDKLAIALAKLPSRTQQIEEATWTVWSRSPTAEETELMSAYLEQRKSSSVNGLQQMIWALVNNPEFRFNH